MVSSVGQSPVARNVRDEEDHENDVVLMSLQTQLFIHPLDPGIADVRAIEEGEKIEQEQWRNNVDIDLSQQPFVVDGMSLLLVQLLDMSGTILSLGHDRGCFDSRKIGKIFTVA